MAYEPEEVHIFPDRVQWEGSQVETFETLCQVWERYAETQDGTGSGDILLKEAQCEHLKGK